MQTDTHAPSEHANQILAFELGAERYGFDLLKVQEIKGHSAITPIPNAPSYMKGVMNLRGTVVPVLSLREKFGMAPLPYDKFTVIIVVTIGARVVGLVVDAVSDVMSVQSESIEPPPDFGGAVDTSFITGMAKLGERFVVLLDIGQLVGDVDSYSHTTRNTP